MEDLCKRCQKAVRLCVCDSIRPVKTRTHVVILQHPQEPDKELGSAVIANLALVNSTLKVGLSWPNLKKVLGREAVAKEWLVLYLGAAKVRAALSANQSPLVLVDKKGNPRDEQSAVLSTIKGLVVLDGNWSQAKAMWWRNPWMIKLNRGILIPGAPSLYGRLRREPRRESISTIESIALALSVLEPQNNIQEQLLGPFRQLLKLAGGRG